MDPRSILYQEPLFWSRIGMADDPTRYDEQGSIRFLDADWSDYLAEHRAFFQRGVKVHTSILHSGWVGPDQYDYSAADRTVAAICGISPDLLYLPRIKLNAPISWCLENPEEVYLSGGAPRDPSGIRALLEAQMPHFSTGGLAWNYPDQGRAAGLQSFCSEKWLSDASRALQKILERLENGRYGRQIVGYQIGFGMCAENAYWGGWVSPGRFGDFGWAAARKFGAYCAGRFGSEAAAARAFGLDYTGDPVCLIPTAEKRGRHPADLADYFRVGNEQSVQYARFLSECTAGAICQFAETVKAFTGKPAGAFYGYLFSSYPGQIGHLAIERLMQCEALDFLASPKGYYRSGPGEPGGAQGPSLSVMRKKLWLDELDNGTQVGRRVHNPAFYPQNLSETRTVLWREAAKNLSWNNQNFWWMDLGGKWFCDESVMDLFPPLLRFIRNTRAMPRKSVSEILFVLDENSLLYQNEDANFMGGHHPGLVNEMAAELLLCGAPVEQYRLRDLPELNLSQYRLIVFSNVFSVEKEMRAFLKTRLPKDALCLWHYAAGIRDPEFSLENTRDLTGIGIAPYAADFSVNNGYGIDAHVPPIRILPAEGLTVLARYEDGSVKTARRGRHILCAAPHFKAADFARLAASAGCRLYAPAPCAVYADSRFVGIFPQTDQPGVLRLPEDGVYADQISGLRYEDGQSVPFKAKSAMVCRRV